MTETKLLMCLIQAHLVLSHHTVSVPWTRPNQAANVWKILSQFSYTVLGLRAVVIKPERWNILSLNVFETGGVAAEAGAYPSYNRAEAGYVLDGFYAIYCKKNVQFFYVLWVKTLHKLKYNTHGITGLRAVVG